MPRRLAAFASPVLPALLAVGFLVAATPLGATTAADVAESRRWYQEALTAYRAGDMAAFLRHMTAASELRPSHPTLLVQRAVALAANGDHEAALAVLERVAAMGMAFELADEPAFAELAASPRFVAVTAALERNAEPAGAAARSFRLAESGLVPEGLACASDGGFFLGSVRERAIYRVTAGADATAEAPFTRFAALPYGAFGLAVDPSRGALWAVSSAAPPMRGHCTAVAGRAALLELDLATGAIRRALAAPPGEHLFGDLTLAADGTLYWSDSSTPAVYRWDGAADAEPAAEQADAAPDIEPWLELPGLTSPQGLALLPGATAGATDGATGGETLILADYSLGLHAIDLASRAVRHLPPPADATLLGIDGLYRVGERTLYAVQNGTTPQRVLRVELDPAITRVVAVTPLLAAHPDLDDPTLGAVCGDRFHFVANAQWPLYDAGGAVTRPDDLRGAVVLALQLPGGD